MRYARRDSILFSCASTSTVMPLRKDLLALEGSSSDQEIVATVERFFDSDDPAPSDALRAIDRAQRASSFKNQPRTPQHNSWIERENRETKGELALRLDADECSGEKPVSLGR